MAISRHDKRQGLHSSSPETVDRSAAAMETVAHAHPDGARARDEPEEIREARQPPSGAVEAALAGVHCPSLRQELHVKNFGKMPEIVRTIEEVAAAEMAKRAARKMRKLVATPSSPSAQEGGIEEA
jgi:hypothetical protein